MGLRMKKFYGGLLKNPIFRGGGFGGKLRKKGGLGQFADLRRVLSKKRGW